MACIIFGAGSYYGLTRRPEPGDYIIAADGGWQYCKQEGIVPDLLLGDFDSLAVVPDFAHIHRVPVEKDDSDMMLAIKDGLSHGQIEFHLYGGMGGVRSDHTLANIQSLLYLTCHGAGSTATRNSIRSSATRALCSHRRNGASCRCSAWVRMRKVCRSPVRSIRWTTRRCRRSFHWVSAIILWAIRSRYRCAKAVC